MLADSHCHLDRLDLTNYNGDLALALAAARQQGVGRFLCVAIDLVNLSRIFELAERYENVWASVGLHPNENVEQEPTVAALVELAQHPRVIALGETGLDYYRSQGELEWQRQRFRQHIRAAKLSKKPLIIHTREAQQDTLRILQEEHAEAVGGVMHCFTETWEMAQAALALGFYISFSGIITFANATALHEVVKKVPLSRMLIETDSPYLAPIPFRGKPNEPAYVRFVAERIAVLKNVAVAEVEKYTTENFCNLFKVA